MVSYDFNKISCDFIWFPMIFVTVNMISYDFFRFRKTVWDFISLDMVYIILILQKKQK